jgi:hypothetical protein
MRQSRILQAGYCYHITIRCNNREFKLTRRECRQVLLYALAKCRDKFGFRLYGLCIMSNHVHYLLEPAVLEDLPKIIDFSNYGTYDQLTDDGLTQWHPAFLALAASLELCAAAYRKFCKQYQPKPKPEKRYRWGSKLLAKIKARGKPSKKVSPGQKSLWEDWDLPEEEILQVAEKFVQANEYPHKSTTDQSPPRDKPPP